MPRFATLKPERIVNFYHQPQGGQFLLREFRHIMLHGIARQSDEVPLGVLASRKAGAEILDKLEDLRKGHIFPRPVVPDYLHSSAGHLARTLP